MVSPRPRRRAGAAGGACGSAGSAGRLGRQVVGRALRALARAREEQDRRAGQRQQVLTERAVEQPRHDQRARPDARGGDHGAVAEGQVEAPALARARTAAPARRPPAAARPASTNENGPNVLRIRSTRGRRGHALLEVEQRGRLGRRGAPAQPSSSGRRPAEAGLGLVPEADRVLALLPAQVDLAAVAERREVEQAAVEVAQHDLELAQLDHRVAQLEEALGDRAARVAAAVRRARPRRAPRAPRGRPSRSRAARMRSISSTTCGQQLGRLLERVVALVDHAAARAPARMRRSSSSASASETVRSWPWKARCQCSAGHLRTCSSSPDQLHGRHELVLVEHDLRLGLEAPRVGVHLARLARPDLRRGPRTSRPSRARCRRRPARPSRRRRSGRRARSARPSRGGPPWRRSRGSRARAWRGSCRAIR